ncbi:CAF1-domain-containing protein [Tothia fuscella]|uniref:CAF1-domain-containing protein n=1 Tax=Tothia fuscella TaxID=1048955 RepID=A0A9P4P0R6_9PEZI|nr:CAF1-domain-containing protein [Tothia fuscella]
MDVGRIAFLPRLLGILEAISEAHFVSIDLELSGVPSRSGPSGEQNLKSRYQELRQAAARYQILQIGLTTAKQDPISKTYILRPYNFPLDPCVKEKDLNIERIFSFQSGACDFLLNNGFDFHEPFQQGVPYLSRDEEEQAKQNFRDRNDKSKFTDIVIGKDDTEALDFIKKIRKEINEWLNTGKPDSDQFSITSRSIPSTECSFPELQSFDRRLVHQIIRAEYPNLTTQGRHLSVTIRPLDEDREKRIRKERKKNSSAKILRQVGFRWIVEALTGGKLDKIDLEWFAKDPETGCDIFFDKEDYSSRFNRANAWLKTKRPVLVGHNCFTDLVYFYQCFIGELPEKVEEFAQNIHELFPVIVDTKYLATHNCGSINPASSLQEIEEELRKEDIPRIETHKDHMKYYSQESFHEAGYDSYLTARIMTLLSAKLEAAGTYIPDILGASILSPALPISDEDDAFHSALESLSNSPQKHQQPGDMASIHGGVSLSLNTPSIYDDVAMAPITTNKKKKKKAKVEPSSLIASKTRFASKTPYDLLSSLNIEDDPQPPTPHWDQEEQMVQAPQRQSRTFTPGLNPTARTFANHTDGIADGKGSSTRKGPDELMPPFESDFWRVYANRLRVFGTEERFLELDPQRESSL